jgi:hypothetical protein
MAVRTPSPFDSPPVSPLSPRGALRQEILFQSWLQKTPPLEKIFVVSHCSTFYLKIERETVHKYLCVCERETVHKYLCV